MDSQQWLTTEELAQVLKAKPIALQVNFHRHKETFVEGRDYCLLTGDAVHEFLQAHPEKLAWHVRKAGRIRRLTLWTLAGAFVHVRFLTEARKWQSYDELVQRFQTVVIDSAFVVYSE